MTDHKDEQLLPDEPKGGWEKSERLYDSEITSLVCCKYTGLAIKGPDFVCLARDLGGHANIECAAVYVRGKTAEGEDIPVTTVYATTVPAAGNDPNALVEE